jgi:hypothetical protein
MKNVLMDYIFSMQSALIHPLLPSGSLTSRKSPEFLLNGDGGAGVQDEELIAGLPRCAAPGYDAAHDDSPAVMIDK